MTVIFGYVQKLFSYFGLIISVKRIQSFDMPIVMRKSRFQSLQASWIANLRPIDNGYSLIRIGDLGDGGYLLPNDLSDITFCFSPGCGNKWKFEKDLLLRYNIPSAILDSETSKPLDLDQRIIYDVGLLGTNKKEDFIDLDSWIRKHFRNIPEEMILQMDIEQAEWDCLRAIDSDLLRSFRILIIEFHGGELIAHPRFFNSYMRPVFDKILKDFDLIHIHGNNCCGIANIQHYAIPKVFEVTFHNKSRRTKVISDEGTVHREIPHRLDVPNVASNADVYFTW